MEVNYEVIRRNMVENQIRTNKITDGAIIEAFTRTPREKFLPEHLMELAYVDHDLMISKGRYILEPMVLGMLLQWAQIQSDDIVLEIGPGTGYGTAIISNLANTVVALEEDNELAAIATNNLLEYGADNAAIMTGPLNKGYKKQSPYNVIVISGSVVEVPNIITQQLAEGGRLVGIVSGGDSHGKGVLASKFGGTISFREVFDAWTPNLPGFEQQPGFVL